MLKIKDNVDLKELEKFGFEYVCRSYVIDDIGNTKTEEYAKIYKGIILGRDYKVDCSIYICNPDRRIGFGMVTSKYEYELYKKFVEETLYDLIKADLVEKVEDK